MTYKEIKDRLTKCEFTLTSIKNGTYTPKENIPVKDTQNQLQLLKENLTKQLAEAEKTAFVNNTAVEYSDEEELKKLKNNADVDTIKTASGKHIKEDIQFSLDETKAIAKKVGQAVAKALKDSGDDIAHMKATHIEENSFDIEVEYKNGKDDAFSFHIIDDILHLADFSFDKELVDVGVKPSGEPIVNVDVLANELMKHFKSMNEVSFYESSSDKIDAVIKKTADVTNLSIDELGERLHNYLESGDQGSDQIVAAMLKQMYKFTEAKVILKHLEGHKSDSLPVHEGPYQTTYVKVAKSDYKKAMAILDRALDPTYTKMDIVDDDGAGNVIIYFNFRAKDDGEPDEDMGEFIYDLTMDLQSRGVEVADASHSIDEAEGEKDMDEPDIDIGHVDDEPDMLQNTAYETTQYAAKLVKKLQKYNQHDGEVDFPNWWQSKLILAREYIASAYHYLDSKEKQPALDQLALEGDGMTTKIKPSKGDPTNMAYTDKVNEGRGDMDTIINLISDKAAESGFSEKEEAMEVMEAIGEHYEISFEYGRLGEGDHDGFESEDEKENYYLDLDDVNEVEEDRYVRAAFEDLEQVIRNLAHTVNISEDEALEMAIRKLEAMLDGRDDMDEGVAKTKKAHDQVVTIMKGLAKKYKAGDKSVVDQLKSLTVTKKKLEAMLDNDVAGTGVDQELDTVNEVKVGDTLTKDGKKGKVTKVSDTQATVDFGNGDVYGIAHSRIKSGKIVKEAGPGFKHDCAAKVIHKEHGAGNTIPEKHTLVKEGNKYVVTHYDVLFENNITVLDIPVNELDIKTTNEHWHKGYKKKKK